MDIESLQGLYCCSKLHWLQGNPPATVDTPEPFPCQSSASNESKSQTRLGFARYYNPTCLAVEMCYTVPTHAVTYERNVGLAKSIWE
jgi:hypothetical protein